MEYEGVVELLSTMCIFSSYGKGLSSIHATVPVLRLEVEAVVSGVGDGDCHIEKREN